MITVKHTRVASRTILFCLLAGLVCGSSTAAHAAGPLASQDTGTRMSLAEGEGSLCARTGHISPTMTGNPFEYAYSQSLPVVSRPSVGAEGPFSVHRENVPWLGRTSSWINGGVVGGRLAADTANIHRAAVLGADQRRCGTQLRDERLPLSSIGIVTMSDGGVCCGFVSARNLITTSGHCLRPKGARCSHQAIDPRSFTLPGGEVYSNLQVVHNEIDNSCNLVGSDWAVLKIPGEFPSHRKMIRPAHSDGYTLRKQFYSNILHAGNIALISFDDYRSANPIHCAHFYGDIPLSEYQRRGSRSAQQGDKSCAPRGVNTDPNGIDTDCDSKGSSGCPYLITAEFADGTASWAAAGIIKGDSGAGAENGRETWDSYGAGRTIITTLGDPKYIQVLRANSNPSTVRK